MITRIAIALITLLPQLVLGQGDPLVEAYRRYQSGDVAGAREFADRAVASDNHTTNPEAWLLHGFIYKDLFKDGQQGAGAEELRTTAINSLYNSITFDQEETYTQNARQAYDYMVRSYYNDAARALGEMDAERAVTMFNSYKETIQRLDPKADIRTREIEFSNALGTVHTKRFNRDRTDTTRFHLAVESFKRVLELEPENYGANYNLATLYYNRGVFKIRAIDAEADIPSIQQIQEASREYFQAALPYMLKAHDMNPTRRETLLGLDGIYYSLQDQENADKYRLLFEELPSQEKDN